MAFLDGTVLCISLPRLLYLMEMIAHILFFKSICWMQGIPWRTSCSTCRRCKVQGSVAVEWNFTKKGSLCDDIWLCSTCQGAIIIIIMCIFLHLLYTILKVIGIKVIDGKQLKRLERLWPLYRLGRIALTGAASMAALLLIDDFIASKVSLEAYAKRFTHFDYAENLYRRAPTRFERITQQANNLCRETFKKFF